MEEESREQALGKGYKYLAMGLRFAGGIVVFFFAGFLLDRWLGTTPLFLLIGTLAGAGLGFLSVYRELMADEKAHKADKAVRRPGGRR
ncbi:MAG TPA: AtpZ/AtpI family protein [Gemmatimonadales bacterium]|nr:AtpZ/AtpI family protein [Gemmatimonadales bacterium]